VSFLIGPPPPPPPIDHPELLASLFLDDEMLQLNHRSDDASLRQKRSCTDILQAAGPCSNLTVETLTKHQESELQWHRCPSTATTPSGSSSSSPRDSLRSATSISSRSVSPLTLGAGSSASPCASDLSELEEDDTESVRSDCTDAEILDGTGVPCDADAAEVAAFEAADFAASFDSCIAHSVEHHDDDDTVDGYPTCFRVRQRALGMAKVRELDVQSRWDNRRPSVSSRTLAHFTSGKHAGRITRLQMQSANICLRRRDRKVPMAAKDGVTSAPVEIENPYADAKKAAKKIPRDPQDIAADAKPIPPKKVSRAKTQRAPHSLAAKTRPAMVAASTKHRVVLEARAVRKQQLKHGKIAATPRLGKHAHTPNHLRVQSAPTNVKVVAPQPKKVRKVTPYVPPPTVLPRPPVKVYRRPEHVKPPSDSLTNLAQRDDFDHFRHGFYQKYRACMETSLDSSWSSYRVSGVRFCPIAPEVRNAFMKKKAALANQQEGLEEEDIEIVYHGTKLQNMQSICNRGLLVPDLKSNGVRVANGSALGLGVYSAFDAGVSVGYGSSCRTIFVCAALVAGASTSSLVVPTGTKSPEVLLACGYAVFTHAARILPLFLLDFEWRHTKGTDEENQQLWDEPRLRKVFARKMLREIHARERRMLHEVKKWRADQPTEQGAAEDRTE
jgi:hypothetical protein